MKLIYPNEVLRKTSTIKCIKHSLSAITQNLVLISLIFGLSVEAQQLRGSVHIQSTGRPLEGFNILHKVSGHGVVTNHNGLYKFDPGFIINPTDTLVFSYVGFNTRFLMQKDCMNSLCGVYLTPSISDLKEVTVVSMKTKKKRVQFTRLRSMSSPVFAFGAILFNNNILISGGDQSFHEDKELKSFIETEYSQNNKAILVNPTSFNLKKGLSNSILIYKIEEAGLRAASS